MYRGELNYNRSNSVDRGGIGNTSIGNNVVEAGVNKTPFFQ